MDRARVCSLNRNVVIYVVVQVLSGAGTSISFWVLLSPLLYLLSGTFMFVAYAEGAGGLFGALVSVPSGWLADKYTRSKVARVGLVLKLLAYTGMGACVWFNVAPMVLYWILFAFVSLEGIGGGIGDSPLQTMFADSTRTGDRSFNSSVSSASYSLGSVLGPVCAIALIAATGHSSWTLDDIRWPWTVGVGLRALACVSGMLMRDKDSLGEESEDVAKERVARGQVYRCCCFSSARHVPYLLVAADLMSGIASGMTIKFFPLWLEQIVGLAPMQLNGVGAGQFLSIAVGVACAQRVARRVGRVQVMLGVKFASFCVFASMIAGEGRYWNIQALIATLHVVRSGLSNAGGALSPSILSDYVGKTHRARWQAMDMITSFGWSGSSMLGALILGSIEGSVAYRDLFLLTLGMQALATLPLWVLAWLVPRKEESVAEVRAAHQGGELKTDTEETRALLLLDDAESDLSER